jgi:tRNA-uridine 2-sulfurtransferase
MGKRVVVAMSGGVDSSVAAALLVEQGFEVIGVMLRLWAEIDAGVDSSNKCCSLEAVDDARLVANKLGIPFYLVNAERPFRARVVDSFLSEYASAQTPNPCLVCNREIRFGYLWDYARSLEADLMATGHYARICRGDCDEYELWRGADRAKDQSYALHVLGQEALAHTVFPVGLYTKSQVRLLAAQRGLPTASKADSQDLCFVADGDYRRFLRDWAPEAVRPGPILDRQGRQIGTHHGLPFYTIGQRSGLGIAAAKPLYVLQLDLARNAVVVGAAEELGRDWLMTGKAHWVAGHAPSGPFEAGIQIRYRTPPVSAIVTPTADGQVEVSLSVPLRDITPGQAAVFYQGDRCLGGAIIMRSDAH